MPVWLVLSIFGALGAGYIGFLHWRLKKQHAFFVQQQHHHSLFTQSIPAAWCAWTIGHEDELMFSDACLQLLDFEAHKKNTLLNIYEAFEIDQFSPMSKAIQHLIDFGGSFHMQITAPQTLKLFNVVGKQTEVGEDGSLKKIIILYFTDTTKNHETTQKNEALLTEVQKQNRLLSTLMDVTPMALWGRDPEGRIIYCNQPYASALDATRPRVIAENLQFSEGSATNLLDLSKQALAHQEKMVVRSHIVIGGERRLLEMAEIPLNEKGMTGGYALDITEVEEIDKRLNNELHGYEDILNQLSTAIGVFGVDTCLKYYNAAYLKIFQFNENFLNSKPTLGEILDDLRTRRKIPEYADFKAHKQERLQLFTNLMDTQQELSHLPDGTTLRLLITPQPNGGLVFLFDNITDKLVLERGFNTLIAVQRETIDHLREGILVIGTDFRIRISNPAVEKIWDIGEESRKTGVHFNDWVTSIAKRFTTGEKVEDWQQKILSYFSARKPASKAYRLQRDRFIECNYVPLPDGSHMLCFVDLSDQWRYEKALKSRNRTLETVDKAKTDFISHVSYELKSPLNTITGFSEILSNQYFGELNTKQLDYCRAIQHSAHRLIQLLTDIVDLTSIETGKFTLKYGEITIQNFLQSTASLVESRANDQGIDLNIKNDTNIDTFSADEKRLKHALFNILNNALKYTPQGGKITLRMENTPSDVHIYVEDTGVGMDHEKFEDIQDLFKKTTKNKALKKNQLGLPLIKNLIELHHGSVTCISAVDAGTVIKCTLPLDKPVTKPSPKTKS